MGNKQSTPARSQSAKGADQVRKRDKGGKGKRERPTSAPPGDNTVSTEPSFFPRPSADPSGKLAARSQEVGHQNTCNILTGVLYSIGL